MVLGKLCIHVQKNELSHNNQLYTKVNSKLIMELNVRVKIIKHLKESTKETL